MEILSNMTKMDEMIGLHRILSPAPGTNHINAYFWHFISYMLKFNK